MNNPIPPEITHYWEGVLTTLKQRRLLLERPQQGGYVVPQAQAALLLPDRAIFVLDMQRLGNIPRERWLDPDLHAQIRATLGGHAVVVTDSVGLALQIAREPVLPTKSRLATNIPLVPELIPEQPYQVCLGYTRKGAVQLDIAGEHRAILVGGTSGYGKTNFLHLVIQQLAVKHSPQEVQLALVDTKLVDFQPYAHLPHRFRPVAHTLDAAAELVEAVASEMVARQQAFARAGVSLWEAYNALAETPLPLLVLIVDEAADFAKTATMSTLVEIARKGRAFGISVIVGTQHPTTKVIDSQVKANLPTAIAFLTKSFDESRVILGKGGAEQLHVKGRALAFLGAWQQIQTLYVGAGVLDCPAATQTPGLTALEADLIRYAETELAGAFIINRLYPQFKGRISKYALTNLAQQWEQRGWLTPQADAASPRHLTPAALELLV